MNSDCTLSCRINHWVAGGLSREETQCKKCQKVRRNVSSAQLSLSKYKSHYDHVEVDLSKHRNWTNLRDTKVSQKGLSIGGQQTRKRKRYLLNVNRQQFVWCLSFSLSIMNNVEELFFQIRLLTINLLWIIQLKKLNKLGDALVLANVMISVKWKWSHRPIEML